MTEALRRKIGQLFMISFTGVEPSGGVMRLIHNHHVGGILLFASNCPDIGMVRELLARLRLWNVGEIPLCFAVDHEGGRVHRLPKPVTHFPPMNLLGKLYERLPSSQIAFEVGRAMGDELRALGFHLNFAPVLDVRTNLLNKVIGDRAFSGNPGIVSLAACQLIEGMQKAGIAACGKHFPGHGDTFEDSHELLPRLPHNRRRLESVELPPFEAAIQRNVAGIMTAHVVYDGIDKGVPATFSVKILRDLLRDELGFEGLVVSDDLAMGAISNHGSLDEACIKAFMAGCDLLLVGRDPKKTVAAIDTFEKAAIRGDIPEANINAAYQRILRFKKSYCSGGDGNLQSLSGEEIGCKAHQELLNKINQMA